MNEERLMKVLVAPLILSLAIAHIRDVPTVWREGRRPAPRGRQPFRFPSTRGDRVDGMRVGLRGLALRFRLERREGQLLPVGRQAQAIAPDVGTATAR